MCSAMLLPAPDKPLRMTMRTGVCSSTPPPAARAVDAPSGARWCPPCRRGAGVGALFLVLLYGAVELVGQEVDGGVHGLLGRVGVDGIAAHVQRRLGLLSQLLHRQHAVYVDDTVKMPADALELLHNIAAQRWGDFDVVPGDVELHGPSPIGGFCGARSKRESPWLRGTWRRCGVPPRCLRVR